MPSLIMPVDVAMSICLAPSPPLRGFLGSCENYNSRNLAKPFKPLRSCISSKTKVEATNRGWKGSNGKAKKRVIFADSKGMSLTVIHVFKEFEEDSLLRPDLQFERLDLKEAVVGLKVEMDRSFVLDFPQPAADYIDFRNRLKKNLVCLENCVVLDRSIMGMVKVSNISFEKAVHVRITFDSWKSYQDVPCVYLNNLYGSAEIDTFSFTITLPGSVSREDQVEFCISYSANQETHWDNNNGKNYRLAHTDNDRNQTKRDTRNTAYETRSPSQKPEMELDEFGSPRTSSGFFPKWQSWGTIENSPYW